MTGIFRRAQVWYNALSKDQCQNQWRKGLSGIVWMQRHPHGSWDKSKNPYLFENSHNSQLGNSRGSGTKRPQSRASWNSTIALLGIMPIFNGYGLLLYYLRYRSENSTHEKILPFLTQCDLHVTLTQPWVSWNIYARHCWQDASCILNGMESHYNSDEHSTSWQACPT